MSKSVWGPATWTMLHCLVLKIKDDANNIEQLKTIISSICDNLPCPYCASHARGIIQKSNFSKIQDILSLRVFVFQLHNKVNERLKKPQMEYSQHLERYKISNLVDVINTFIKAYNNNSGTTMMLYSFHKKQTTEQLKNYFRSYAPLYVLN
jgi:predicted house-cleaning noncanonical NTP pyrophosphatase (MazG superfamily)